MMPSLFISHGPPDRVINESPAKDFLMQLSDELPKPKAIVIFSAHWFSEEVLLTTQRDVETIHDMYGFPKALYQVNYNAVTPDWLVDSISDCLIGANVKHQKVHRGLDHGAWSVLKLAYPDESIPVIGVSIPIYRDFQQYIALGCVLAPLRKSDYLIIGSGSATHNLGELNFSNKPAQWAIDYVKWLQSTVTNCDYAALAEPYQANQLTRKAHPTPDHYIPLLIAAGASMNENVNIMHDSYEYGTLNNTCFQFG